MRRTTQQRQFDQLRETLRYTDPGLVAFVDKLEEWRALDLEDMHRRDHLEAERDRLREQVKDLTEAAGELAPDEHSQFWSVQWERFYAVLAALEGTSDE